MVSPRERSRPPPAPLLSVSGYRDFLHTTAAAVSEAAWGQRQLPPKAWGCDRHRHGRRLAPVPVAQQPSLVVMTASKHESSSQPSEDSEAVTSAVMRRRWCCAGGSGFAKTPAAAEDGSLELPGQPDTQRRSGELAGHSMRCCGVSRTAVAVRWYTRFLSEHGQCCGWLSSVPTAACTTCPGSDAGNTFTAAAHILTAVVGAGVLALPYSLAMLGW